MRTKFKIIILLLFSRSLIYPINDIDTEKAIAGDSLKSNSHTLGEKNPYVDPNYGYPEIFLRFDTKTEDTNKTVITTAVYDSVIASGSDGTGSSEDSLYSKAMFFYKISEYDSAMERLGKLLKFYPNSARGYDLYGGVLVKMNELEKAKEMFHKSISIDSAFLFSYENLGYVYSLTGNIDSAINIYKGLILKDSSNADYYFDLGNVYIEQKDTARGENYYKQAVKINPNHRQAHINLANINFSRNKYKETIDELFLVRNLDDWYPLLQNRLSVVSQNAKEGFENWVNKEPDNSEAHYYYAFSLWYTNEGGDAIDEIERAIGLNPLVEKYYLTKAIWLTNQNEYEEAISECEKCLELNQQNWMCHNCMSLDYSILNQIEQSLEHLRKSVEIDSQVVHSQLMLGEVYGQNKEFQKSIESLQKARILGHSSPIVYLDLAIGYYNLGDYDNAWGNAMIAKNIDFAEKSVKKNIEKELEELMNKIIAKIDKKL